MAQTNIGQKQAWAKSNHGSNASMVQKHDPEHKRHVSLVKYVKNKGLRNHLRHQASIEAGGKA